MVELGFLINDILACNLVSGVQNQAANTKPSCSMTVLCWSFFACCLTPTCLTN